MSNYYDKSQAMTGNLILNYSPNFSRKKRISKNIKFLIIHYTGMRDEKKAINRLTDVKSKVSSHYFIKKNGKIIMMVPPSFIAWHAGKSKWKKYVSINKYSIGIELQNKGHRWGYTAYTKIQIKSLIKLCRSLIKKYQIINQNILGHSDIAYDRKKDPGEKFPWEFLSNNKIGIWHKLNKNKIKNSRNLQLNINQTSKLFLSLSKIGYSSKNLSLKKKAKLIIAFQRRFRPELINGKIDLECYKIGQKLSKI